MSYHRNERGIALILVVFIVALASILVVNLAYSTYLDARLSSAAQRTVQAEYILKSAVNLARVLIKQDKTKEDSANDDWGRYLNGVTVPLEFLGINEKNVQVTLEIRPEDSKFSIRNLAPGGSQESFLKWRGRFVRLFQSEPLKFDEDEDQVDQTGIKPDKHFDSEELVANLIDYMDDNTESYSESGFKSGIESEVPEGLFPPTGGMKRIGELSVIPGFTPQRVAKLMPLVTVGRFRDANSGSRQININIAPKEIIRALDENITEDQANQIFDKAHSDQPFEDTTYGAELSNILDQSLYTEITSAISVSSNNFQVIAKVDYGTSRFYIRAYLLKKPGGGELPTIVSLELF